MRTSRLTLILASLLIGSSTLAGQSLKPDSIPGYSSLYQLKGLGGFDHPRVSPDGRWLGFDAGSGTGPGHHIWIMPLKGGTPVQVTTGDHADRRPVWTGKRQDHIAFWSNRTGGVMAIGVDPATMQPRGVPTRVSTDSINEFSFDATPDGTSIIYAVPVPDSMTEIRSIPLAGGPHRTLVKFRGIANAVRVDAAGQFVYYMRNPGEAGQHPRYVDRVSIGGGAATTVQTIGRNLQGVAIDPIANRVAVRNRDVIHVMTLNGDSVTRIPFVQGLRTIASLAFTPDGAAMISATDATTATLETLPLDGSPLVRLTDSLDAYWPDKVVGKHLYYSGDRPLAGAYMTLDGKEHGQMPIMRPRDRDGSLPLIRMYDVADNEQWMLYSTVMKNGDSLRYLYDAQTKKTLELGKYHGRVANLRIYTNGDTYSAFLGDDYISSYWNGDKAEVYTLNRQGMMQVIRTIAMSRTERRGIALAPGKFAEKFTDATGTHVDITIGNGQPVRVLTIPKGSIEEMVFSHDGAKLFTLVWDKAAADAKPRVVFFSTGNETELRGQPLWLSAPEDLYHFAWTPDDQSVIAFGYNQPATRMSIWRFRNAPGSQAELLSRRETSTFWDYAMSPDGKYVVVPAERNNGINIWKGDLKKIAKR